MQNYTHRTKPTKYILQQKKEIRQQTLPSAETAAENALYAEPSKHPTEPHKGKIVNSCFEIEPQNTVDNGIRYLLGMEMQDGKVS